MSIRCGNCKDRHDTVTEVKACYGQAPRLRVTSNEIAYAMGVPRPVTRAGTLTQAGRPDDGFYTVVFTDGDYRTIRLRTQEPDASFAPGEQVASFLSGPDNESDYTGFAFVKADGRYFLWKRFRQETRLDRALNVLLSDPDGAGEEYALRSGRCRRCNRQLTVPASINRGFGPTCAGIVGA